MKALAKESHRCCVSSLLRGVGEGGILTGSTRQVTLAADQRNCENYCIITISTYHVLSPIFLALSYELLLSDMLL